MKKHGWIIVIIVLAAILRFWSLTAVPPALNSDEVAIGYNAYSILTTGRDEYNTKFPLLFRSFDDYKMPVYVYMVAGTMKVFGYNDFAVRFPSALFGTLTVLVTYVLAKELCKKFPRAKRYALASSFLLAISPWSIHFSRSGYEANVAVFFVVLGTYLFLTHRYILSSFIYSLAVWTYLTPRLFVPLLVIGLTVLYWRELWKYRYKALIGVVVGLVSLWPIVRMSLSPEGQMRAAGVSAFANADDIKKSAMRLSVDRSPLRIFDNRRMTYVITFLRGYFAHFDPNFLFLDKSIDKYRAPDTGLLYLFELPLIGIGCYVLVKRRSNEAYTIAWWVFVAPVAAACTLQLPHPVRTLVFLPTFQVVAAIGLVTVWETFPKLKFIVGTVIAISVLYYIHQYFMFLPIEDAPYWYVGRREMTQKIASLEHSYDRIIVSNSLDFPYIFYLYYRPITPRAYLQAGGTVSGGFNEQGNHVDTIEFRSISSSLRDPEKKILFVGLPGEVFKKSLIVDEIRYPDGTPAIDFFQ